MLARFFLHCRFALTRAWINDRTGMSVVVLLLIVSLALTWVAVAQYSDARNVNEAAALQVRGRSINHVHSFRDGRFRLSQFHSHELLDALNEASAGLALPVNEMVFRFDDSSFRPYLRYSATVRLFGGYPAVRKFVDAVRKQLPQTSLDAISCVRTDIQSVRVSCELTLSAFYRRGPHE